MQTRKFVNVDINCIVNEPGLPKDSGSAGLHKTRVLIVSLKSNADIVRWLGT